MKEIRLLKADEIECRVQSITEKGCVLLLYKDARTDMNLLDETFGRNNWQRYHEVINGNLYCNIEIWDEAKKCWVRKQDVGVESRMEAEKGQASDAFKRAGFNIGIGRELYTAPFIWINLSSEEVDIRNGKPILKSKVKFSVSDIKYQDRVISDLSIIDQDLTVRYDMKKKIKAPVSTRRTIEADLKAALKRVDECETIGALEKVWKDNKQLWTLKAFKDKVNHVKSKLEGNEAA